MAVTHTHFEDRQLWLRMMLCLVSWLLIISGAWLGPWPVVGGTALGTIILAGMVRQYRRKVRRWWSA